ncbi:hypothetical protein E3U43_012769, partial [Larimichthys crocea]
HFVARLCTPQGRPNCVFHPSPSVLHSTSRDYCTLPKDITDLVTAQAMPLPPLEIYSLSLSELDSLTLRLHLGEMLRFTLHGGVAPAGEKPVHLFLSRHPKDTRGSETSASPQTPATAAIVNTNIIIICG